MTHFGADAGRSRLALKGARPLADAAEGSTASGRHNSSLDSFSYIIDNVIIVRMI